MDKFYLPKRRRKPEADKHECIRVPGQTYRILVAWSEETGLPLSQLAARAINYANEHLEFITEGGDPNG